MNFRNLARIAEDESRHSDNWYINNIIDAIVGMHNEEIKDKSFPLKQVVENIKKEISDYTEKQSHTSIKTKTIEYYISKRCYSPSKYNLDKAYKDVCKEIEDGKISIEQTSKEEIQYTYNLDENMKMLVSKVLCKIKEDKNSIFKFMNSHEVIADYFLLSKKSKDKLIKTISSGDKESQEIYKKLMTIADKNEKELLEAELKKYTEKTSEEIKSECISSIRADIELMDKYGLMKNYVEANNALYKNIYLFNCDYTYEEVMEQLSEKKLKGLSVEQLIGMAAYWDNRSAKSINEINKAIYILSHPELYESKTTGEGELQVNVADDVLKNIHLKMNILQKISFEVFDEAEWLMDEENDSSKVEIGYEVDEICEKYEKDYKNYFDKKLQISRNELRDDMIEAIQFENSVRNLYLTKSTDIQALLISTLNSGVDKIQNFGYIEDSQRDIKNFIIVGVDIPGMNMPLRLHTRESSVLEVLKSAQNGSTEFPKYKGASDFTYRAEKVVMPTQIYVPVSDEKAKQFKEAVENLTERDRYANTIRHIGYIAGKVKMPEHMINDVDKIQLRNSEKEWEK